MTNAAGKEEDTVEPVASPWQRIVDERQRQVSGEGWSAEHDDQHDDGSLLQAAVFYLWHGTEKSAPYPPHVYNENYSGGEPVAPMGWPWDVKWWKPKDRIRNLERAGALCLADRDRRVRNNLPTGPADHKLCLAIRELSALLAHPAASPDTATVEPTHRHKKLGSEYVLIGFGKMQAGNWQAPKADGTGNLLHSVDMREVAIYRSVDDGSLWVRPREEFEDGRFEALERRAALFPAPPDNVTDDPTPGDIMAIAEATARRCIAVQEGGFLKPPAIPLMALVIGQAIVADRAVRLPAVEGWRAIETAPKDGTPILICRAGYTPPVCRVVYWDEDNLEFPWKIEDGESSHAPGFPTHWQPLPAPPVKAE